MGGSATAIEAYRLEFSVDARQPARSGPATEAAQMIAWRDAAAREPGIQRDDWTRLAIG